MKNLRFGLLEESGMRGGSRILMCYSYETDDRMPRSGILHYAVAEGRFLGPRQTGEITEAALQYLTSSGRLPTTA